ncbi:hypothetical protein C8F04DRAFT_1042920 [Mycena alexandri]|uniref:BTB domain-containing protein n=1 Tax=Mycena alexandri TaxID=1745969 RepID=A0AAD6SPF4_9AGAR|nr:hypothetical protein C8F04DRAFT_1042920 [Mycena alexandri]
MSSSAKRQRTEDAPITRSEIWYQDGSVVLQAQDTQFRVHFGVLAAQSAFFRDMQGLPQPPDQPTVEGCPVVEIQDDVSDVKHLLTAVYDPIFMVERAVPLPRIASLIRLGRKYDFKKLLDLAVERLTFENPTTLAEYNALKPNRLDDSYTTTRIVPYQGILFDMLTLARENNILTALPCAYYRALAIPRRAALFDGIPRGDGTVATLAQADQRRCVLSYDELNRAQFRKGYPFEWVAAWDFEEECKFPDRCTHARTRDWMKTAVLRNPELLMLQNPKHSLFAGFCTQCRKRSVELTQEGQKKAWDELPSFFSLPPWSELKNDL